MKKAKVRIVCLTCGYTELDPLHLIVNNVTKNKICPKCDSEEVVLENLVLIKKEKHNGKN